MKFSVKLENGFELNDLDENFAEAIFSIGDKEYVFSLIERPKQ